MEITKKLYLDEEERTLVEMHSALNLLNILTYELLNLSDLIGSQEALLPSLSLVQEISSDLSDKEKTIQHLSRFQEQKQKIQDNVINAVESSNQRDHKIESSIENIQSLLSVLEVRTTEIISREHSVSAWKYHDVQELKNKMREVFEAFEQNSKGRYSIVYNEDEHDEQSYLICCSIRGEIRGEKTDTICMPPELQDVLRDLTANARKYSDPGGYIDASLVSDGKELVLKVEDTGRGIPKDQLETIVDYGFRASNAQDKRNYGGGFGLTKAYYITKKYNGRMWIDSVPNEGTVVTIKIPVPEHACTQ